MYHIQLKNKDLVHGIIWKYEHYVKTYKDDPFNRENIYVRAFTEYLVLSGYGIFPKKAAIALDELVKLHLGYTMDEINQLTQRVAQNNINSITKTGTTEPLSEGELKAVTEYHKVLFGDYVKNEEPFKF